MAPARTSTARSRGRAAPSAASAAWSPPTPRRVRAIRDRLRLVYGIPGWRPHGDPLAELVLTVLSQSTNDRNRDVAYLRLRERFESWEAVRDAPVDELEEAIRPGGISKVKSARIKAILEAITATAPVAPAVPSRAADPNAAASRGVPNATASRAADPNATASRAAAPNAASSRTGASRAAATPLGLDWLAGQPVAKAQAYLCSLPGVGRKTAACVLLFALGMRDVPVDTHVSRVGTRLGLLRPGAPFEELHDEMLALTPPGQELELHVNLLRHGRRTCHARRPACGACALARMCPRVGVADGASGASAESVVRARA